MHLLYGRAQAAHHTTNDNNYSNNNTNNKKFILFTVAQANVQWLHDP